jgi:hypothetical protein
VRAKTSVLGEAWLTVHSYDRDSVDLARTISLLLEPNVLAHVSHMKADLPGTVTVA